MINFDLAYNIKACFLSYEIAQVPRHEICCNRLTAKSSNKTELEDFLHTFWTHKLSKIVLKCSRSNLSDSFDLFIAWRRPARVLVSIIFSFCFEVKKTLPHFHIPKASVLHTFVIIKTASTKTLLISLLYLSYINFIAALSLLKQQWIWEVLRVSLHSLNCFYKIIYHIQKQPRLTTRQSIVNSE